MIAQLRAWPGWARWMAYAFLGILLLAIAAVCLIPLAAWGISSVVSAFSTLQPGEALNSIVGNSMF